MVSEKSRIIEGVEKVGFSRYFYGFFSKTTIYGSKIRVFLP